MKQRRFPNNEEWPEQDKVKRLIAVMEKISKRQKIEPHRLQNLMAQIKFQQRLRY